MTENVEERRASRLTQAPGLKWKGLFPGNLKLSRLRLKDPVPCFSQFDGNYKGVSYEQI